MNPSPITVFTVANRRYEPFVLPYIASVLYHNPTARIEVALEHPPRFKAENAKALEIVTEAFGNRHLLTDSEFSSKEIGSYRFLITPTLRADYVYIGDVDILILEDILSPHLRNMTRTGLPYSNIRRPNMNRLSGLHFTMWDAFYPQVEIGNIHSLRDEALLYALIESRGLRLPDPDDTFRPQFGYHLSLNRLPYLRGDLRHLGWNNACREEDLHAYLALRCSDIWQDVVPLFDFRYRCLLTVLEAGLHAFFQEKMAVEPVAGTTPKDWWD